MPAIIVGGDDITNASLLEQREQRPPGMEQYLMTHGASAYLFYDAAGQKRRVEEDQK